MTRCHHCAMPYVVGTLCSQRGPGKPCEPTHAPTLLDLPDGSTAAQRALYGAAIVALNDLAVLQAQDASASYRAWVEMIRSALRFRTQEEIDRD